VTDQISALVELAREEHDLIGEQFLHWFLEEQLEEVSSMTALLRTVERASAVNILLAEDFLARTAGTSDATEAGAPRAAGGAL
jgi:ferritin